MKKHIFLFILILSAVFLTACDNKDEKPIVNINKNQKTTFMETADNLCAIDGKPVIRLFSTTWCPHCKWGKEPYENIVKEYIEQDKIIAHHWEIDIGDDSLTPELEIKVPQEEMDIFQKYNPQGSIPTFVFGCRYIRIGTGHEIENDKEAEEAEFREIIEKLIAEG